MQALKAEMTWNDRLKLGIETKNVSQSSLARYADMTKQSLGMWIHKDIEKRPVEPKALLLLKVCEFLGVRMVWVLTGDGDMNANQETREHTPSLNDIEKINITDNYDYQNVATFRMDNETFAPRIEENDILLIDRDQATLINSKLYLIKSRSSQSLFIKRYWSHPIRNTYAFVDGDPKDEDNLSPEDFDKVLDSVEIIGQVIARHTTRL